MTSPFTWDKTHPAGGDALNAYPALAQADKATLLAVLGTLVPFGTPTLGWRIWQDDNKIWLVTNAKLSAHLGTWSQDDNTVDSYGFFIDPTTNNSIQAIFMAAGQTTWTTTLELPKVVSVVNWLQLIASATGVGLQIKANGSDGSIQITLAAKGNAAVVVLPQSALTTAISAFSVTPTWNAAGVTFPGALLVNATDTASQAASLLADFQKGGVSQFKVDKSGNVTAVGTISAAFNRASFQGGSGNNTASATFVSTGQGVAFKPGTSGFVLLWASAAFTNNTAGKWGSIAFFRNTTGIPTNGTAVGTDTQIGMESVGTATGAGSTFATAITEKDNQAPVVGTQYYYYIAFRAAVGGTVTLNDNLTGLVLEL